MTLRGLRTLHARMRVHAENTRCVVDFLAAQPAVERVYYPGLADHPGHEIARRQQSGFGAMLSFELEGGDLAVEAFLTGLQCFSLAESLGGVESLIAHPATMTHAGMEEAARLRAGIGAGLLRVSVGIEEASGPGGPSACCAVRAGRSAGRSLARAVCCQARVVTGGPGAGQRSAAQRDVARGLESIPRRLRFRWRAPRTRARANSAAAARRSGSRRRDWRCRAPRCRVRSHGWARTVRRAIRRAMPTAAARASRRASRPRR